MRKKRSRQVPQAVREGPIEPGSPLYRALERIAQEVAKALDKEEKPKTGCSAEGNSKRESL